MNKKTAQHINEFYVDQAVGPPSSMSEEEIDNLIKSLDFNINAIRHLDLVTKKDLKKVSQGLEMFVTSLVFRMLNINRAVTKYRNSNEKN